MRTKRTVKLLAIISAISLIVGSLAGCGSTSKMSTEAPETVAEDKIVEENEIVAEKENPDETKLNEAVDEPEEEISYANLGADLSKLEITGNIIESEYQFEFPDSEVDSSIYIEKIDDLSESFIRGMDISSLLAEEASGVKFHDFEGREADLLKILAQAGVNCVRVRVWNDPFDEEGNGYGGGNCNAQTAAEIGARAAKYGIKLCVDFHYSDFWADPSKQFAPKAWENYTAEQKSEAIYNYTYESLVEIINAGADLYMVQLGNEINTGMAGEKNFDTITDLLKSGSKAVRDVNKLWDDSEFGKDKNILIAVHYTNIDNPDATIEVAERYAGAGLDYDVFGVSYYPYWHGSFENMTTVLKTIHDTYKVDTCVMETSYMYTGIDGDGSANSVSDEDALADYPISVQGQANCIRDVFAAAATADSLGVFYWEGAWIPVGSPITNNSKIWNEKGSGWASKYAAEYDPDDAGKYYGGSSWDNQAFFDWGGYVLESINVFNCVYSGAVGNKLELVNVKSPELIFSPGEKLVMPKTIEAVYNDTSIKDGVKVKWDEEDIKNVDMKKVGVYTVGGTALVSDGTYVDDETILNVTAKIKVADINYVINPGFEEDNTDMWVVESMTDEDPTDILNKSADAYSGNKSFHYWSEKDMEFTVSETFTAERNGSYKASAFVQGGDFGTDFNIYMYVSVTDANGLKAEYQSSPVIPDGWVQWQNPEISGIDITEGDEVTIGIYTKAPAKAWATYDDFTFMKE